MTTLRQRLDTWFDLTSRGSTVARECRGGVVTFAAMAYILVLNPLILGTVRDRDGNLIGGAPDQATAIALVMAATAFIAGVLSIIMGVAGRLPMAVAAGLGLNSFIALTLVPTMTWRGAMGLVVLEGLVILALVLTGLRRVVYRAVPAPLRYSMGAGIGLFIAFVGLTNAGFVQVNGPQITMGDDGRILGWPLAVFVVGLLLMIALMARRVTGAILIGIVATTVLAVAVEAVVGLGPSDADHPTGWSLTVPRIPEQPLATPDLSLIGQFDLLGAFSAVGVVAALVALFSLVLPDFFDTLGTAFALADEAGIVADDGDIPHLQSILVVDSLAAGAGGACSVSSNTTYVESATGIADGARTGIAALVTGVLMLMAMFLAPVVAIIPFEAAAPALVIVGYLMLTQIRSIDFLDIGQSLPAFFTMIVMPFTMSLTNGIGAGFIVYVVVAAAQGRARSVPWPTWLVAGIFVLYFLIPTFQLM